MLALLDSTIPANSGFFDSINIVAEPGSIVWAQEPAPTSDRETTTQRIADVIFGAFPQMDPKLVTAAGNGAMSYFFFSGTDKRTQNPYVYVETIGGGICQVSTTMYNAVLLADLAVVERKPHFFPATYVPIGLDATVNYGTIDFQFRNTRQSDIYLWINVVGNQITVAVLGNTENEPVTKVRYQSRVEEVIPMEIVKIEDATVPYGQEVEEEKGNTGYISATYRVENGVSKLAYRDRYPASKRVVRVAPKSSAPIISEEKEADKKKAVAQKERDAKAAERAKVAAERAKLAEEREEAKLKKLQKENEELRQQVEILKKAAAYFAKENKNG